MHRFNIAPIDGNGLYKPLPNQQLTAPMPKKKKKKKAGTMTVAAILGALAAAIGLANNLANFEPAKMAHQAWWFRRFQAHLDNVPTDVNPTRDANREADAIDPPSVMDVLDQGGMQLRAAVEADNAGAPLQLGPTQQEMQQTDVAFQAWSNRLKLMLAEAYANQNLREIMYGLGLFAAYQGNNALSLTYNVASGATAEMGDILSTVGDGTWRLCAMLAQLMAYAQSQSYEGAALLAASTVRALPAGTSVLPAIEFVQQNERALTNTTPVERSQALQAANVTLSDTAQQYNRTYMSNVRAAVTVPRQITAVQEPPRVVAEEVVDEAIRDRNADTLLGQTEEQPLDFLNQSHENELRMFGGTLALQEQPSQQDQLDAIAAYMEPSAALPGAESTWGSYMSNMVSNSMGYLGY